MGVSGQVFNHSRLQGETDCAYALRIFALYWPQRQQELFGLLYECLGVPYEALATLAQGTLWRGGDEDGRMEPTYLECVESFVSVLHSHGYV